MHTMSIVQAEQTLTELSVKHTGWYGAVGGSFKIYKIACDFDPSDLPNCFEVLWSDPDGSMVIREWREGTY